MANFLDYAWLIPLLPALAFVLVLFLGRWTPNKGGLIALVATAAAGLLAVLVFWEGLLNAATATTFDAPFKTSIEWFRVTAADGAGDFVLTLGTYIDPLSAFMLFIVGILVTLIVLYSQGYMEDQAHGYDADGFHIGIDGRARYFAAVSLFIVGMLGMLVANNYLMMFMFWEIMGLCSYLLIGFWYARESAAAAQKKAFLVTRIGDVFFLIGLAILLVTYKTLDFDQLFAAAAASEDKQALLIANICLFLGAVGKSAQFPLHVWLPDAMEGPTTVSALIHAATMVKAGVYLVARSYPLFVQTPEALLAVAVIGGFTALFAASMALVNNDLKRVLAYSTLSQLGYMFLGLGVAGALFYADGNPSAALTTVALTGLTVGVFHLFSHAFFKAGLFLSAGSVGHALHSYDMRKMGGLRKWMPITAFTMLMGTISISGIPPFSGFYSKDAILAAVYEAWHTSHATVYLVLYGMAVLTAFMTAYYMFRLYLMTFEGTFRGELGAHHHYPASEAEGLGHHGGHGHGHGHGHAQVHKHDHHDRHDHKDHGHHVEPHEGPWTMTATLAILSVFAIFGAIIVFAFFGGLVGDKIHAGDNVYNILGVARPAGEAHHGVMAAILEPFGGHHLQNTLISIGAAVAGITLAFVMWRPSVVEKNIKSDEQITGASKVLYNRYYIDNLYNAFAAKVVVGWGLLLDWIDRYVVDGIVNGIAGLSGLFGRGLRRTQTGNVQDYTLTVLIGVLLVLVAAIYLPLYVVPFLERAWETIAGGLVALFPGGI
ncbi:MAG TPA: NADH-quinone oxidoreductase subunit L [Candidatus Thermoplasmatota archaeon]|nr:NADH-quinone oxidoreductase subunit L [Candidatus Thermoplasmatota archaeon]